MNSETTIESSLPVSTLTKHQKKTFRKEYGDNVIVATVRHDDECGNGHNTFAITAEIYEPYRQPHEPTTTNAKGKTVWLNACGCCHEEIAKHFPGLAPLIKWHLMGTNEPMHYVANTLYFAGDRDCWGLRKEREFDKARSAAVWPEATDEELSAPDLKERLIARLPALMEAFKRDVESLGFTY